MHEEFWQFYVESCSYTEYKKENLLQIYVCAIILQGFRFANASGGNRPVHNTSTQYICGVVKYIPALRLGTCSCGSLLSK